jgi:hypothetical protein
MLLGRASFQLQHAIMHMVTTTDSALSPAVNKSLHTALVKMFTSEGDPLSHSWNDVIIIRKMFLAYLVGVEGQSDRSCQTSIR